MEQVRGWNHREFFRALTRPLPKQRESFAVVDKVNVTHREANKIWRRADAIRQGSGSHCAHRESTALIAAHGAAAAIHTLKQSTWRIDGKDAVSCALSVSLENVFQLCMANKPDTKAQSGSHSVV
ncbi:hypothetical protein [Paraburkholderia fungorum]|uniref:hypothetical protein n=1 Tax=Paraburkholderia fungorum TaxID=134537 RepID=UPI002098311E|nr:hypothetical protein [Paraburkholderia fungorum]USX04979.1 hypothetical protein NHH62_02310 [Paraburkholderia fungorum]